MVAPPLGRQFCSATRPFSMENRTGEPACWCAPQKTVKLSLYIDLLMKVGSLWTKQVVVDLLVVQTCGSMVDYEEISSLTAHSPLVFHGETVPHSNCIAPVPAGNTFALLAISTVLVTDIPVLTSVWLTIGESHSHLTLNA